MLLHYLIFFGYLFEGMKLEGYPGLLMTRQQPTVSQEGGMAPEGFTVIFKYLVRNSLENVTNMAVIDNTTASTTLWTDDRNYSLPTKHRGFQALKVTSVTLQRLSANLILLSKAKQLAIINEDIKVHSALEVIQLQAPAALSLGKQHPIPLGNETG
jgi:hypothetical protein